MENSRVKNIVECGIYQGWSKDNIIGQIMYEIATKEEVELLSITNDLPYLEKRAIELFNKYRKAYYKNTPSDKAWLGCRI